MARFVLAALVVLFLACFCQCYVIKSGIEHKKVADDVFDNGQRGSRQKRFIMSAIGVASAVVGLAQQSYDLYSSYYYPRSKLWGPEGDDSAHAIKEMLQETAQILDDFTARVENVMQVSEQNPDMVRLENYFSRDVARLKELAISHGVSFDGSDKIVFNTRSEEWAEGVLSEGADGVSEILQNIHELIIGASGPKPLLNVYMESLVVSGRKDVWDEMELLIQTTLDMEQAGYSYWVLALIITKRPKEQLVAVEKLLEDRMAVQARQLLVDQRLQVWPEGEYGIVQETSQCLNEVWAIEQWSEGIRDTRYLDTRAYYGDEYPTYEQDPEDIQEEPVSDWKICLHRENSTVGYWPAGRYCVIASSESCPPGLQHGGIYVEGGNGDGKNPTDNGSSAKDEDTSYDFCCRTDGNTDVEIVLPILEPFVLFPLHEYQCQKVYKMVAEEIAVDWDFGSENVDVLRRWPYPKQGAQGRYAELYMCRYTLL